MNALENEMNKSDQSASTTMSSQKSFDELSASINSKLEILDRISQNDSISEETPKESTKLSDQFSPDKSDTINQLSAISNSTLTPDNSNRSTRATPTPPVLPIPGIEFAVPQSPVRLDASDIEQLPDVGSTFSSSVNTSTSLEMTNQLVDWAINHGIAYVRQTLAAQSSGNGTLDRLENDTTLNESSDFQPIQQQSHNSSLSSFLRNEAELAEQVDEQQPGVVSETETEPVTEIEVPARPSRSAEELLAEVVELHEEVVPVVVENNTLERVHDEEDSFKVIGNDDLTEESAAFEALENEVEQSNLSNIEEVTEESSKDITPAVPEPSTGASKVISIQEAFKLRKQKFIENSQKRQEKVKGTSLKVTQLLMNFFSSTDSRVLRTASAADAKAATRICEDDNDNVKVANANPTSVISENNQNQ